MKSGTQSHNIPMIVAEINKAWDKINDTPPCFKIAHDILIKIDPMILYPAKRANYYLALGRAFSGLGKFKDAIEVLNKIPSQMQRSVSIGTCMAICYENLKDFHNAEQCLNAIDGNESNIKVLLSRSHLYEKMGRIQDSEKILNNIIHKKNLIPKERIDALLSLGRLYQTKGQLNKAEKTLKKITFWKKNRKAIMSLSILYTAMGRFDLAYRVIAENLAWENDINARLCLSRIFEATDRYEEAITLLTVIEGWEQSRYLRLAIGRCCHKAGYFIEAENHFHGILSWQEDTEVLLSMARCKMDQKLFEEAEIFYKKIPNWKNNVHALLGLFHCYEKTSNLQSERIVKNLISHFPHDNQARLTVTVYQEQQIPHDLTTQHYAKLAEDYPYFLPVHYHRCRYLLSRYEKNAIQVLNSTLDVFPFAPNLYLLKAKFFRDMNDMQGALEILQYNSQQFPFHISTQLELIRHHLLVGDTHLAVKMREECKQRFSGHDRLFKRIDRLFEYIPLVRLGGNTGLAIITDEEESALEIPHSIQEIWSEFETLPGITYLVGSTPLFLYLGKTDRLFDLDLMNPHPEIRTILPNLGFVESNHIPGLFVKHTESAKIDYLCHPHNPLTEKWCEYYEILRRDFTISSFLGYRELGSPHIKFLDLTGMGKKDASLGILRMIGHAKLRLEQDPVLCLRAAHYARLGFTPEPLLNHALLSFQPDETHCSDHLLAVARGYMVRSNPESFVEKLQEFDFLEKLFDFKFKGNLLETVIAFKKHLGIFNYEITELLSDKFKEMNMDGSSFVSQPLDNFKSQIIKVQASRKKKDKIKGEKPIIGNEENLTKLVSNDSNAITWTPLAQTKGLENTEPENRPHSIITKRQRNKKSSSFKINTLVKKVAERTQITYKGGIKPSELEAAKQLTINQLRAMPKSSKINLVRLEADLTKLFDEAVYPKNLFQLISPHNWLAGCYTYGVRLESFNFLNAQNTDRTPRSYGLRAD